MNTHLARRQAELVAARRPFVHATVVRAAAPTSVSTGDHAIVLEDGTLEGFVGGQCTLASVKLAALDVLRDGASLLLRVLPEGGPEFPATDGARVEVNPCLSGGAVEIYLEPVLPAPVVHVVGTSPIARAVADLAGAVGYEATSDEDGATAAGAAAVVIARHGGPEPDDLRAALAAEVPYVGLVASTVRGHAVLDETGLDEDQRARVHTPAGLPISAGTPEEIALSILAEIVSVLRARDAAGHEGSEPPPSARPAVATDPVCGMNVVVAPDAIHLDVDGTDYYFCRPGCRDAFKAEHSVSVG
ncbi:YHS domain-containing protein [Amycolatopsis rubida]|uniref:Xanthine dehydrogenase accessory factor n=2 Tax=Amycolatopsis TaxID=1813 RepID=A0A2N3WP48_9PSEU|nr:MULTISPECIES: XdhC family protein [Amycolatopsis]MYW95536.1 YHS domain-containing protein [Amycolatopsis rubida]NEC60525.1 YHS domain-containing protein [Amycolatopsis rubida]PKV95635.1 xanthine dehydrogenase accessory factor [Amycolatopsis niigatensis]SFP39796.1 xanthine dehydrogenase accessory factor [Amycolatopsis rubida]